MSFLKKIQNYVKEYSEIISEIVQCDVEIVDENMIRIAGTGYFEREVNEVSRGTVYQEVFITKKSRIIKEPKLDEICDKCNYKDRCNEKLEISAPIFYKDKVIGVIGLICFTDEDKKRILKNINSFLRFTEKIAEFISGKVFELEEELEKKEIMLILKDVINSFDKAVLVIDTEGKILDANDLAITELQIDGKLPISYQNINIIPKNEVVLGKDVFLVEINKNKFTLVGTLITTSSFSEKEYKIFLFENFNAVKNRDVIKNKYSINNVDLDEIISISQPMKNLKDKIKKISKTQSTVLITGESGTGKELVARAIHSLSDRAKQPFIAINCGAIPENLLESELFGYVKGAFSGASNEGRVGKFELANNGVIFLDEIGEMPLPLQVKLLRVIQERSLVRVGSNKLINLNIRIIAATNVNLFEKIKEGKFREDLYYRLNVIPLSIPPLRERREDIMVITKHLIHKYSKEFNSKGIVMTKELEELFFRYDWLGNVRELENCVEFLMNMADDNGKITDDSIEEIKNSMSFKLKRDIPQNEDIITLEENEKIMIKRALEKYGDDTNGKNITAEKLGIGIATLYRKIEKYQLSK